MTHSLDPRALVELRKILETLNKLSDNVEKLTEAIEKKKEDEKCGKK